MTHSSRKTALSYLGRVLALVLALSILPFAQVMTAEESKLPKNLFGSELMDNSETIMSSVLFGDTYYVLTYQSLYGYKAGDAKAQKLSNSQVEQPENNTEAIQVLPLLTNIFTDGERLLGFDNQEQKVYEVAVKDGKLDLTNPVKMDMDEFVEGEEPYSYFTMPSWMQVFDGKLYTKFNNYENKEVDLYSFDLKTGEKTAHKATHLQALTPYKDGTFLGIYKDPQQYFNDASGERIWPELVIYNPADDSVTKHPSGYKFDKTEIEVFNLYYDAAEDSLYTNTDTDLYRLDGDFTAPRLIGYLPTFGSYAQVPNGIMPFMDGRLAVLSGQNVFVRERTEAGLTDAKVLTMIGNMDNTQIINRIMMEMDDVVVRRMEGTEYNQLTAEQTASLFLTGNIPADIMSMNVQNFDIDKLIEKGYLADLSGNEKIAAFTKSLTPNLGKFFDREGKIYNIPSNTMVMPAVVYPARFEAVGLKVPTSLMELLEAAEAWVDGVGEQFPDYSFLGANENLETSLRQYIFDRYISNALGANEELVFDTPVFRALIEKLDSIDFGDYATDMTEEQMMDPSFWEEMSTKKQLIEINMGYDLNYMVSKNRYERGDNVGQSVVLSMETGGDAFVESDFSLMMVLSTSPNKDIAIEFLGHLVDKLDPVVKAALNPAMTDPIPNPYFEQEIAQFTKYITQLEAQLKTAEGAIKSNLEQSIKSLKDEMEHQKDQNQYLATAEALAMTHSYLAHTYIMSGLSNAQRQAYYDGYELRDQLENGAINLDQYIKQMDDKLRLVRMEYQ